MDKKTKITDTIFYIFGIVSIVLLILDFIYVRNCYKKCHQPEKEYESGGYIYNIETNDVESFASIIGFTGSMKDAEIIVIPEEIDGLMVRAIDIDIYESTKKTNIHYNVKRLYIPFPMYSINFNTNRTCMVLYCVNEIPIQYKVTRWNFHLSELYVTSYHNLNGDAQVQSDERYRFFFSGDEIFYANVSYMYNYDTDENYGYYWIDLVNSGSLIDYIPEDPVRDGYTFGGWYKEKECLNKWDFHIDVIPTFTYDERYNRIEPEAFLYAKWIKE